jgi:hypothetical protein
MRLKTIVSNVKNLNRLDDLRIWDTWYEFDVAENVWLSIM